MNLEKATAKLDISSKNGQNHYDLQKKNKEYARQVKEERKYLKGSKKKRRRRKK